MDCHWIGFNFIFLKKAKYLSPFSEQSDQIGITLRKSLLFKRHWDFSSQLAAGGGNRSYSLFLSKIMSPMSGLIKSIGFRGNKHWKKCCWRGKLFASSFVIQINLTPKTLGWLERMADPNSYGWGWSWTWVPIIHLNIFMSSPN